MKSVLESPTDTVSAADSNLPLRGEAFSADHLDQHFRDLASRQQLATVPIADGDRFSARFEANAAHISQVHALITQAARNGEAVPAEAEWLLDNYYVVEEQLREIRDDLPRGFYQELPKLISGDPRVYELARELVVHTDSSLDPQLIERSVQEFQTVSELSIGEVWAVPIMLRLVLVENLRRLSEQMHLTFQCQRSARRLLDSWKPDSPFELLHEAEPQCVPTIIQLVEQLPDRGPDYRNAAAVLERQLGDRGWQISELVRTEHQRQAANQVSIGNVITSMRLLAGLDWIGFFERVNLAEQVLRTDPMKIYEQMHFESRDHYRHVVEEIAKRTKRSDIEIAKVAVQFAHGALVSEPANQRQAHVGFWLIGDGRKRLESTVGYHAPASKAVQRWMERHPHTTYFGSIAVALTVGLLFLLEVLDESDAPIVAAVLLVGLWIIPLSEIAQNITNFLITNVLSPRLLPRFEYADGVPDTYPTIIVVPSMLSSDKEVDHLIDKLENHYLSNSDNAFSFALLTDYLDANEAVVATDASLVERAVQGIRDLNQRYGADGKYRFYLFHRKRLWNPAEKKWMGWERKRGKLMEFGRLLQGAEDTSYVVQEGDLGSLQRFYQTGFVPFVITLDSDTQLPHNTARKLVGTLAHPLNRPEFSRNNETVTSGYTILQPRVNVHLESAGKTQFSRLYSGNPGVDPYVTAASDVYQDLFGEGSFTGKGIYDLHAFERALGVAFPENAILSHDLIEGCHARVGLVSNIEVFDGYPARYEAESRRTHRWVRGDWQLLPWLFPSVPYASGRKKNPLSLLSRWKVFDNLRRSLVAPTLVAGLVIGWMLLPRVSLAFLAMGIAVLLFPLFIQVLLVFLNWPQNVLAKDHFRVAGRNLLRTVMQCALAIATLPHKALQMIDAIIRTLYRLAVSRTQLLEWETAAAVDARLANQSTSAWRQFWGLPLFAVVIAIALPFPSLLSALPFLGLWIAAPKLIEWVNEPIKHDIGTLTRDDRVWLRKIISQTWSFFEAYVGQQDNWLPVDNVQEEPQEKIAHRLSPTNEGLFLVSALVAREAGYLGTHQLADLFEKNLDSLEKLEQLNGHFYNWYDTETLQPLAPRYISTVDSGNLVACLLTAHSGLQELIRHPIGVAHLGEVVSDSVQLLIDACDEFTKDNRTDNRGKVQEYRAAAVSILKLCQEHSDSPEDRKRLLQSVRESMMLQIDASHIERRIVETQDPQRRFYRKLLVVYRRLVGMIEDYDAAPHSSLKPLPDVVNTSTTEDDRPEQRLKQRLKSIAARVESIAIKMDFRCLYNPQRKLFSIGWNVEENKLDRSHYDMLCSEARLASYLAIAKGDVEANHWFRLGRHATLAAGRFALLSWGGTMFEYLMPPLFQKSFSDSLLTQSCEAALQRQIEYGAQQRVPWGISESAFGALAVNADYHYRSFGVPGLGLKRGLAKDLVISPYSTLMALPMAPAAAVHNLRALEQAGAHGRWGFYESLDFTVERLPVNKKSLVVRCYMAHHQGMGMLGLANALYGSLVQKWFNTHPLPRATELLLQERVPAVITPFEPHADEVEAVEKVPEEQQLTSRRLLGVESPSPRVHLLSNGTYSVMLSSVGGGYSRSGNLDVTRWRCDTTKDDWGQFIYLRDAKSHEVWSATYQPTRIEPDAYEVIFAIDKVDYRRQQGTLESVLEVAVSPEHNAEVRLLRLVNHGETTRTIEVTSYTEVVLTNHAADLAHPAFQKLFMETEYIAEESALFARRRPRDSQQPANWALHVLASPPDEAMDIQYETSRQAFLGRTRDASNPTAVNSKRLTQTTGAVLDPVFSLRCTVEIKPGAMVTLAFTTATASSREEAYALADQYHELRNVQRVFELAWAYAQVELRHQHLTPGQVHLYLRLATYLLYPHRALRGDRQRILANRLGQNALWRHGISGDLPILLAHITDPEHLDFIRDLALAQRFWKERGLKVDLVVINAYPGSYYDALHDQIVSLLQDLYRTPEHPGVYVLKGAQLAKEEADLLEAIATCVLYAEFGSLANQLEHANQRAARTAKYARPIKPSQPLIERKATNDRREQKPEGIEFWNGVGGFSNDGREYFISRQPGQTTPMPWSHVVSNERIGFLLTESGGGYTWFENSRENKLSSWSNDPVVDPPSEVLYLQNDETGELWCPLSSHATSAHKAQVISTVHYGAGYADFCVETSAIKTDTRLFVAEKDPVKLIRVRITNSTQTVQRLRLTYFVEVVLGVSRDQAQLTVQSRFDEPTQALIFSNPYHPEYANQSVFLTCNHTMEGYTANRSEFLGRHGSWQQPAALVQKELQKETGVALDPCGVVQTKVELQPQQTLEVCFLLGAGQDYHEAEALLRKYRDVAAIEKAQNDSLDFWNRTLGQLEIESPDRSLNFLINRWLPYQVLSCRMWGRSAFYQSGGAYGFRDQLQDSMALVYLDPSLVRRHLLLAASRQYRQGDVQHWWHPPLGKGTRTRFSDDLLWLPYVVSHYIEVTGDDQVLQEEISFLESPPLKEHEQERYELPRVSNETADLFEHCCRAIDRSLRFGSHDLPLMGCGDWNDGMNKVGEAGTGESVWVGWFLLVLLERFLPYVRQHNDADRLERYEVSMINLRNALESHAWDGAWYRRAYFDDGTPLGSTQNDECQIDSLTQSWAVFAKARPERTAQAMQSAVERLVNEEQNLILLFTPPFDQGVLDPGYIKGYLPGIRENGGQYTHAATWMIQALAQLGDAEGAMRLLNMINPVRHGQSPEDVAIYQTEPYVMAADVYGVSPFIGRGGWTWYTGSAAWVYRVVVENLLGLRIQQQQPTVSPCVPSQWESFKVRYRGQQLNWHRTDNS